MCSPKLIPMNTISMMIMVAMSVRVSTLPPPPCRNGDLVLNGRPRAHQEDPIRALHSPILQSGIDDTKNLHNFYLSHQIYATLSDGASIYDLMNNHYAMIINVNDLCHNGWVDS